MAESWRIIKKCLKTACEIVDYVDMWKPLARVLSIVRKSYPNPIDHSIALRLSNLKASEFNDAINTAVLRDQIKTITVPVSKGIYGSVKTGKIAYIWIGKV